MTIERAFPVAGPAHPYHEFECHTPRIPWPEPPKGRHYMGRMADAPHDGQMVVLYLQKPGNSIEPVVASYGVYRDRNRPDWHVNWSEDPIDSDWLLGWAPIPKWIW